MAGPLRKLEFDVSRFESHVVQLIRDFPSALFDIRGDAYGVGRALIEPALERAGVSAANLQAHDGSSSMHPDESTKQLLTGDEVFGYAQNGPGFARFSGTVVNVKRVPAGRRISYGYTYATSHDANLALVGVGFADGAARRASSLAPVRIGNHTGIIAGRIAMDQFVVDLGDCDARPGDEAVLWGDPENGEPSIVQWSELTGIPALALLSAVGARVTRMRLGGNGGDK